MLLFNWFEIFVGSWIVIIGWLLIVKLISVILYLYESVIIFWLYVFVFKVFFKVLLLIEILVGVGVIGLLFLEEVWVCLVFCFMILVVWVVCCFVEIEVNVLLKVEVWVVGFSVLEWVIKGWVSDKKSYDMM